jgi:hypothetical protein
MEETKKILLRIVEDLEDRKDDWARDASDRAYNSGLEAAINLINEKIAALDALSPKNED